MFYKLNILILREAFYKKDATIKIETITKSSFKNKF